MLQSLNDVQQVIQDSAHYLLTSDKSQHKSPDPVLPPLKFVCTGLVYIRLLYDMIAILTIEHGNLLYIHVNLIPNNFSKT